MLQQQQLVLLESLIAILHHFQALPLLSIAVGLHLANLQVHPVQAILFPQQVLKVNHQVLKSVHTAQVLLAVLQVPRQNIRVQIMICTIYFPCKQKQVHLWALSLTIMIGAETTINPGKRANKKKKN